MRIWGRIALGSIVGLTSSFVITIPAEAAPSHPGGVTDTCPEVLAGAPTGGVEKVTDPPDGSVVRRGDEVIVTLRWDTAIFTVPVLHKALDCVTIDGEPADALSTQERDTANDGRFDYRFTVPGDVADGARLCDRGFVSGPGNDGFEREKSNDVCFVVRGDAPADGPAPAELRRPEVIAGPAPAPLSPTPIASPVVDTVPVATPVADTTPVVPIVATAPIPASPIASPVTAAVPTPAPIIAGPAAPATEATPDTVVAGKQEVALPRTGLAVAGMVLAGILALALGGICLFASRRWPQFVNR